MKNRRYSPKRDKILKVIKKSKAALSAADVHKKIPEIDLTTIYRNLELFVTEGMVKKLSLGKNEAVYEYQEEDHHHAICTNCEKIIHFDAPDREIMKLLKIDEFVQESLEITVRGRCNCK